MTIMRGWLRRPRDENSSYAPLVDPQVLDEEDAEEEGRDLLVFDDDGFAIGGYQQEEDAAERGAAATLRASSMRAASSSSLRTGLASHRSNSSLLAPLTRESVQSVLSWSAWNPTLAEGEEGANSPRAWNPRATNRMARGTGLIRRTEAAFAHSDSVVSFAETGQARITSRERATIDYRSSKSSRRGATSAVLSKNTTCQGRCVEFYGRIVIDFRSSQWWHIWEVVAYGITIVVGFLAPYEVAFVPKASWFFAVVDHFVYLFFLMDTFFHFFVALPDPDRPSCLLRQPEVVIPTYMKSWFIIDMASVSAYPVMFIPGMTTHAIWKASLLRMARLPRLLLRQALLKRFQIFIGFSFAALEVIKYLLIVAMACHWMACLWGGIGLSHDEASQPASQPHEETWLRAFTVQKGVEMSVYRDSAPQIYSVCLYWAIMTLTSVGYGDVCPMSMKEYWVACLCMSLSAALWAFIIGEVCRIAASVDPHDTRFMQTMDDLNYLMKSRHMPRSMRMQMRTYLYEAREVARQRAQIPIIEQMSPMLQGQMAMQLHKAWLEKVWYLREIEGQAVVNIARRLQQDFFAPNEEVPCYRTLFIMRRGICSRRSKILLKGDVWGEDMVVNNQVLRDESPARALSYLEVTMLHYMDLVTAVKPFPEVCVQIQRVKVKIAVMRGVILVARALKEVAFKEEIDITEITEEVESYIVRKVLQGDEVLAPRPSNMPVTRTRRSAPIPGQRRSSSPGRRDDVMGMPSDALVGPSLFHRRSIDDDDLEKPVVKSDLQGLQMAMYQLSMQIDGLSPERRSSRIERGY